MTINSISCTSTPPYADGLYEETLMALARSRLLAESAQVIAEHHHKTALQENYDKLTSPKPGKSEIPVCRFMVMLSLVEA